MATVRFRVRSPRRPEEVLAALTDFSPARTRLWTAIDPEVYELHGAGEGWADATEGSDVMGGIWARERYEWSGNRVRATIVDSNFWHPGGTWEAAVSPDGDGGSTVEVIRSRRARTGRARVLEAMLRVMGARLLARQLAEAPAIGGTSAD